jgi:hypothetical protein
LIIHLKKEVSIVGVKTGGLKKDLVTIIFLLSTITILSRSRLNIELLTSCIIYQQQHINDEQNLSVTNQQQAGSIV